MTVTCTYENPGPNNLTVGESTTDGEMCLTLVYRYPAVTTNASSNNSTGAPRACCFDEPPAAGCGDISAVGLEVLASGLFLPNNVAVDATNVYWVNWGAVMKAPLGGGAPTTLTSGHWANQNEGTVRKVPIGGGTPTTLVSGTQQPQGIAIDATSIYWTDICGKVVKLTPK